MGLCVCPQQGLAHVGGTGRATRLATGTAPPVYTQAHTHTSNTHKQHTQATHTQATHTHTSNTHTHTQAKHTHTHGEREPNTENIQHIHDAHFLSPARSNLLRVTLVSRGPFLKDKLPILTAAALKASGVGAVAVA